MKKFLFLQLTVVLILVLGSCSSKTQPSTSKKSIFYYEKTSCMGPCPVYKFTLYQSGFAEFEGIENINPIGSYSLNLNELQHNGFIELIKVSNLSQYKNEYRGYMTDLPTTKIYFTANGVEHKIIDYANAPVSLKTFEEEIEALIFLVNWK